MAVKEDLRVRRTKKALFDAFMDILSRKSFDEMTVNELCETAEIRRATFYKHYADKYDFLTAYTVMLRDRFDKLIWRGNISVPTHEYYSSYAKRLVHFISENSLAIGNLCKSSLFPSVMAIIVEQNYKDTCERLRITKEAGIKLPASIETTAAMITGGVASCIFAWVVGIEKCNPSELADQVGIMVTRVLNVEH